MEKQTEKTFQKEMQLLELPDHDMTEVIAFAVDGWELDEIHGLPHWQRVERNGIILSMEKGEIRKDINIKVVRYFAYLHDKCRRDNWEDLEHGARSANMLHTLGETILKDFSDEEIALLDKACRHHTTKHKTGIPTVDVCFDADRLDLGRVGTIPNPRRMATKQGAYYAAHLHLLDQVELKK